MKVSVVIPTLNEQDQVLGAIQSALAAGADEVIVADGGSDDQTRAIAATAATIVVSTLPGRGIQQNAGASHATGDVLLFLHADCRLDPQALQELRRRCRQSSRLAAGCFCQRIDDSRWRYRLVEQGNAWRVRILKWAYGDQAIFVPASVFHDIHGFPETSFLEDLLLMKMLKQRGQVLLLDSPLTVSARRWQRHGLMIQTLRNWAIVAAAHLGASPAWLKRFYA